MFIKGRHIHNHSQLVLDILDYNSLIPHDNLILLLNFFKTFDTLEHPFLLKALEMFGFGTNFCNVIQMICNNINSSMTFQQGSQSNGVFSRGVQLVA